MAHQKRLSISESKSAYMPGRFAHLSRRLTQEELSFAKSIEGFPKGEEAAIQAMSVAPYYMACPNPFLAQIVAHWRQQREESQQKTPRTDGDEYHRMPFAADVTEGKQDPIYKVHPYHTKVPPRAIVRYILHYTQPGDIVLDAFCGSGMTGVAAQLCGSRDLHFRTEVKTEWEAMGHPAPKWGPRRVILCDLSPMATTIAANYNLPVDVSAFGKAMYKLINESKVATQHLYDLPKEESPFTYAVWSQVFACPQCGARLNFMELAYDLKGRKVHDHFLCSSCGSELNKRSLDRTFSSRYDPVRNEVHRLADYELYLVARGKRRRSKLEPATEADRELVKFSKDLPLPEDAVIFRLPLEQMYHGSRLGPKGVEYLHDLYFRRQLITLSDLWRRTTEVGDPRLRSALRFLIDQTLLNASKLARFPQLSPLGGVYYLPSMVAENQPIGLIESKLDRVRDFFATDFTSYGQAIISTNSAAQIPGLPDNSVDYVFTDPPFGENIFYADLNLMVEAWYGVFTNVEAEAIVDKPKNKGLSDYQHMMYRSFLEYHRVLKPNRWITVVFHNSNNAVWNAIQEAMLEAGLIVADVRTLDKQQRSYRQVTSSAVKQDLVISAYKPIEALEQRLQQSSGSTDSAWEFVREHLRNLPVFNSHEGEVEIVRERQVHLLYDRMVAAHVQRGITIPMDFADFYRGLYARFSERDGMFFLPEQVAQYDKERAKASKVEQLALFITDEKSAIQWLRRELDPSSGDGPQAYADLQPKFLRELHQGKFEDLPELRDLLSDNFLEDKQGRWYVPDPDRQADMEAVRQRSLLREFNEYVKGRSKLKIFRSEAIRVGFSHAWKQNDYATIIKVADRLPEVVIREDQQLLMYYHNASLRYAKQPRQERLL
jgi:16S rRNA G966 N2-methylase RsmD/transposase-like protein